MLNRRTIMLSKHAAAPTSSRWQAESSGITVCRSTYQEATKVLESMLEEAGSDDVTKCKIEIKTYQVEHHYLHPDSDILAYINGEMIRDNQILTMLRNRQVEECPHCQSRLTEIQKQRRTQSG